MMAAQLSWFSSLLPLYLLWTFFLCFNWAFGRVLVTTDRFTRTELHHSRGNFQEFSSPRWHGWAVAASSNTWMKLLGSELESRTVWGRERFCLASVFHDPENEFSFSVEIFPAKRCRYWSFLSFIHLNRQKLSQSLNRNSSINDIESRMPWPKGQSGKSFKQSILFNPARWA